MIMFLIGICLFLWWAYLMGSRVGRHSRGIFPDWLLLLMLATAFVFLFFGSAMVWGG